MYDDPLANAVFTFSLRRYIEADETKAAPAPAAASAAVENPAENPAQKPDPNRSGKFVRNAGAQLHYQTFGDRAKPCIVFIHGLVGRRVTS